MIRTFIARVVGLCAIFLVGGVGFAEHEVCGSWQGEIGSGATGLAIAVTFDCSEEGGVVGLLDIPAQGVSGMLLANVVVGVDAIAFRIPGTPGHPAFFGSVAAERIEGVYTQGISELTFYLDRLLDDSGVGDDGSFGLIPASEADSPVLVEEVEFAGQGVVIGGSLVLPVADGPVPGVLLLPGSGSHGRDQVIAGHATFRVLSDYLVDAGIAVLRVDDRGVGASTGSKDEADYEDLAGDAVAGLEFLAAHPSLDAGKLGLIGHSQGGSVALVAANSSDLVSFVVMLAGPATSGVQVLKSQAQLVLPHVLQQQDPAVSAEAVSAEVDAQVQFVDEVYAALSSGNAAFVEELVRSRVQEQLALQVEAGLALSATEFDAVVNAQVAASMSEQFASLLLFEPASLLETLKVPVLAVYGDKDVQVPAPENADALTEAFAAAGNPESRVMVMQGVNHLMQPAVTGFPDEYATVAVTIDEAVLELVADWVTSR